MEDMSLNDLQSVLDELKTKQDARISADFKERVMQEARQHYGVTSSKNLRIGMYLKWSVAAMVALVCLVGMLTFQSTPLSAHSLLEMAIRNFKDIHTMSWTLISAPVVRKAFHT